eukprot:scaffold6136_cov117-Skeletonema_marinoi.AAC.3
MVTLVLYPVVAVDGGIMHHSRRGGLVSRTILIPLSNTISAAFNFQVTYVTVREVYAGGV